MMEVKPLWLQEPPPKLKLDQFKLELYPFQHAGAAFLAQNRNCLLRDSTGLGKCPQSLAAYNAMQRKQIKLKCVVVCPASVTLQWKSEAEKFTNYKFVNYLGNPTQRKEIFRQFLTDPLINGLVLNYELLRKDKSLITQLHKYHQYLLIFDEAQKIKNPWSQTSKAAYDLAANSVGNKLLTATPIFNNVNDIFGLFRVINSRLFPSKTDFEYKYTYTRDIRMKRGNTVKMYLGPKNLQELRDKISPYIFGRQVEEVFNELPPLTFKEYFVELPKDHRRIYDLISEEQTVIMSDKQISKVEKLAALSYLQQCVDDVALVKKDEKNSHPKMDKILEIIEEEFDNEKLIVYTKFTSSLDILKEKLEAAEIKTYRIDGRLNQTQRDQQKTSWESEPGKSVLLISSAGGAGLNLQAGNTIIFLNYPWSYGEILQIYGRIRRIGTKHNKLRILNVFCEGTIDEIIQRKLYSKQDTFVKMFLTDSVIPESSNFDDEILDEVGKS